ncbi:MAG: hypothetical protein GY782_02740 [Gammaproteobacteria bacterium]|nr:hypothetical protein [Gammaproteobacteria bacterium]
MSTTLRGVQQHVALASRMDPLCCASTSYAAPARSAARAIRMRSRQLSAAAYGD